MDLRDPTMNDKLGKFSMVINKIVRLKSMVESLDNNSFELTNQNLLNYLKFLRPGKRKPCYKLWVPL